MTKVQVAPTKSNLLKLKRQLAFAEEGYDLLEQKRQILIAELMSRIGRAREADRRVTEMLREAHASLREAHLEIGSGAVEGASLGVQTHPVVKVTEQRVMGIRLPGVTVQCEPVGMPFGVVGTSEHLDVAMQRFADLIPALVELAELQNAVICLARELRKTQRRCNALSRIFIPSYREAISYTMSAIEERERESAVILKMIRERLRGEGVGQ